MATLLQKRDGSWYIRGRAAGGFCTWQVTSEGVRELQRRGCEPGDQLHPDLVRRLARKHLIYTGGSGIEESPGLGYPGTTRTGGAEPDWTSPNGCLIAFLIFLALAALGLLLTSM